MGIERVVRLVQEGRTEKYGEIVRLFEKRLRGYIRNLTNQPREEVEEILQETFIKAYENIQSFDTRRNFGGWIFRIAHNLCLDFFKKKKPVLINDEEGDFWENVEDKTKLTEELMVEEEEKVRLAAAIEKLNINYREVILLYYFEEKSYEEIAEIRHTSISNVGVLLVRAKEKLKKDLRSNI